MNLMQVKCLLLFSTVTALVFKLLLISEAAWSGNFYTAILVTQVIQKATFMTRDSEEGMLVGSATSDLHA